jgi:hypothetical protein
VIVNGVLALGSVFVRKTVAEGVKTEPHFSVLCEISPEPCHFSAPYKNWQNHQ